MHEYAAELIRSESTPEPYPAVMKSIEKHQGNFDWTGLCIRQLRPEIFFIGLDRWLLFGERKAKAEVCIEMAIREVVNDLANGPAAFTIWSIELGWRKLAGSGAELGGSFGDGINRLLAQQRGNFEWLLKLSNRVTRVH